jgi:hypothetical protein
MNMFVWLLDSDSDRRGGETSKFRDSIRGTSQPAYATPDIVISISETVKTCLRKLKVKRWGRKATGKCQGELTGLINY